jgi:hypothetical protein
MPMSWNGRRRGWISREERPPEVTPEVTLPAEEQVVYLPGLPVFSPASFAAILGTNRSTVATWIRDGKLEIYRDNLQEPYILRSETKRFISTYLRRTIIEDPSRDTP